MSTVKKSASQRQVVTNAEPLVRYLQKNANSADAADIFQETITRVLEQARQRPILNPLAYALLSLAIC